MDGLKKIKQQLLTLCLSISLMACGSGGEGGDDGVIGTGQVSGTVAVGKALANTSVEIRGRQGKRTQAQTNVQGFYQIDVKDFQAPFLIRVKNQEKELYSIANNPGTANVHPLSDLVVRNWFAFQQLNIKTLFEQSGELAQVPSADDIEALVAALQAILKLAYAEFAVPEQFHFVTSAFNADQTGFDRLLDFTFIHMQANVLQLGLQDPDTGLPGNLLSGFNLAHPLNHNDSVIPSVPQQVTALAASTSSNLIVWDQANDNLGIAGYIVFRDNVEVARVPVPVFRDVGLQSSTQYCYRIQAIDAAGNQSNKSNKACTETLGILDNTKPAAPIDIVFNQISHQQLSLSWTPSNDSDVLSYHVYRKETSQPASKIIVTPYSLFVDKFLKPATEYCYQVSAMDAAGNESPLSSSSCASTTSQAVDDVIAPYSYALPVGGTYAKAQTVSLACEDNSGLLCAAIYYTLDGSEPTSSSTQYAGPIRISTDRVLRFFAEDPAGNQQAVQTQTYTIDINAAAKQSMISFASSTYSVAEHDAAVALTVQRTGNTDEVIRVDYWTEEDSALVVYDFSEKHGQLFWDRGDSSNKTIYIPIKADMNDEQSEQFNVVLANVSVYGELGTHRSAQVIINNQNCSNQLQSGSYSEDLVVPAGCSFVDGGITITSNYNINFAPGASLIFHDGDGLRIETGASITADGTQAQPILLTSVSQLAGYWDGVTLINSNDLKNSLRYVTIEYAGQAGLGNANLTLYGSSPGNYLQMHKVNLSDSQGYGLYVSENSRLVNFSQNNFKRNTLGAIQMAANDVSQLDEASDYRGNMLDYIVVTNGRRVTNTQTWPKTNAAYFVDGLEIANANLTISPGSTLVFEHDTQLRVDSDAALTAQANVDKPIVFTSEDGYAGDWGGIRFLSSNSPNNILDYVIVEYAGGAVGNGSGAIVTYGASSTPQRLRMSNSIVRHSASFALDAAAGANLSQFANNQFTNNAKSARVHVNAVHYLDKASDYTGNTIDRIEIVDNRLDQAQTWKHLNVSYEISNVNLHADLIIEAGATIYVNQGGRIQVTDGVSLNAVGTVAAPISFLGLVEEPGSWDGFDFVFSERTSNKLIHTIIDHAGASLNSGGNFAPAAIVLYGSSSSPSKVEVSGTIVRNPAGHGIWVSDGSSLVLDEINANTFENIPVGAQNIVYAP